MSENRIADQIKSREYWSVKNPETRLYWDNCYDNALRYCKENGYLLYYDTVDVFGTMVLCTEDSPCKFIEYFDHSKKSIGPNYYKSEVRI